MKRWLQAAAPLLAVLLIYACRSLPEVEEADLQGTWVASQARFVDELASKQRNTDLIEEGYEVVFISPGDGTFLLEITDPEGEVEVIEGTIETQFTFAILTTADAQGAGEVFLEDDQVAFRLSIGLEFVFVEGDDPVPATLLLVMDRVSEVAEPR